MRYERIWESSLFIYCAKAGSDGHRRFHSSNIQSKINNIGLNEKKTIVKVAAWWEWFMIIRWCNMMVRNMKYLILRYHFYQCLQLLSFNSAIVKKKRKAASEKRGKVESKNSNSSDWDIKHRIRILTSRKSSTEYLSSPYKCEGSWLQPWLASVKDPGWAGVLVMIFPAHLLSPAPTTGHQTLQPPPPTQQDVVVVFFPVPLVIISFPSTFSFSSQII